MKKKNAENVAKVLPEIFKNVVDYLKSNFQSQGQKIAEQANGTLGILIKLFAQPLIDKYFDQLKEKKLDNFGFNTYLKSAMMQASKSLDSIKANLDNSLERELIFDRLDKSIEEGISQCDLNDILLIYQPLYHPAVTFVKTNYQIMLRSVGISQADLSAFSRNFNDNIEKTIEKEFGSDYNEHLKRTEKYRLKENETAFLWDTIQQGKIGFKSEENLKYEKTFAQWKNVSRLRETDVDYETYDQISMAEKAINIEANLAPIETLIEDFFGRSQQNHLEEILFIVADFGKGKSVFMRHYAATLAKQYLQSGEGYFPVYFNLRNFKNYSTELRLGVFSDYLETKYSIKIDDEYFQRKKYFFLADSLDESGELNKIAIEKVIQSIKSIQNINKSLYKTNRIIITSRPFDDGLTYHLKEHQPYLIRNEDERDIPQFINIYGFTKEQFNDWLIHTFNSVQGLEDVTRSGFPKEIIATISMGQYIDIYKQLQQNDTLSISELRRPIFAYMIYQLIINNIDFLSIGKIGVYLSFINLLTKEAKHIYDPSYRVNLKEEFEFRNILHATAALWMQERNNGKQGVLKKADICRVLEGKNTGESDNVILERFKEKGLLEIQFLSHSYFGENDNVLHFQHQSFAEILLAEYYLKVFIKYALDENSDIEDAKLKLVLGEPSEQTISFLREMLYLLRETSNTDIESGILEKRKLLFPLMASLATQKNNKLFCNNIFYSWYQFCKIEENQVEYPRASVEKWAIDSPKLERIIKLTANIVNSNNSYVPIQSIPKLSLFNADILLIQNQRQSELTPDMDKWLSLLVGTSLYNKYEVKDLRIFNKDYKIFPHQLFELVRAWNYVYRESAPTWGKALFMGVDTASDGMQMDLSHFNFDGINFSYSNIAYFHCWNTNWSRCIFKFCTFKNVSIVTSLLFETSIQDIMRV